MWQRLQQILFLAVFLFLFIGVPTLQASEGSFLSQGSWTSFGTRGAGQGDFKMPRGIAVDSNGNIYVVDTDNHRIQKFSPGGKWLTSWGGKGSGQGQLRNPYGIAIDEADHIYVADTNNNRIQIFRPDGTWIAAWGKMGYGKGQFLSPQGIGIDASGNVYVLDSANNRVQKFQKDGTWIAAFDGSGLGTTPLRYPQGIAVDPSGTIYIADTQNHRIVVLSPDGARVFAWGTRGSAAGSLLYPQGIVLDQSGNVYVADSGNHRIQKFNKDGTWLASLGDRGIGERQFIRPQGIAIGSDGRLIVGDTLNNRVQALPSNSEDWGQTAANQALHPAAAVPDVRAKIVNKPGKPYNTAVISLVSSSNVTTQEYTPLLITSNPGGTSFPWMSPSMNVEFGLTYTFSVIARSKTGIIVSEPSNAVTSMPPFVASPTRVEAVAGNGEATIRFSPSIGVSGPLTYTVVSHPDNLTVTGTGSPLKIVGLKNGTPYTFTVTAANEFGVASEPSAPSNAVIPSGPVKELSKEASNLTHAHDRNNDTSANLLKKNGFIIYGLPKVGLIPGRGAKLLLGTNQSPVQVVEVSFLNDVYEPIGNEVLRVSKFKEALHTVIPAGASFMKLTMIEGAMTFIWEMSDAPLVPLPQLAPEDMSKEATNLPDAYDRSLNTSSNILSGAGYIIYSLSDLGLAGGAEGWVTLNSNDGSTRVITLDFLTSTLQPLTGTFRLTVSGFKNEYRFTVPADAHYVKINGVSGAAVYIYEISPMALSNHLQLIPGRSPHTTNVGHGFDGKDNTSANILATDGYLLYSLADLGLAPGMTASLLASTSDGSVQSLKLNFVDGSLRSMVGEHAVSISGRKNEYSLQIPANAAYVVINGVPGAFVYLWEMKAAVPSPAPIIWPTEAERTSVRDGNDSTSANILTGDGYLAFPLLDLGITGGTASQFIIGTSDGGTHQVELQYLDQGYQPVERSSITVAGYKNRYQASVPINASYLVIHGVPGAAIYLYEISAALAPSPLPVELSRGATNIKDGIDRNPETSANLLTEDGFIIYNLADIGFMEGVPGTFTIGTSDGGSHTLALQYLDREFRPIGYSAPSIAGFKSAGALEPPAGSAYVKIMGVPGVLVYIWEISPSGVPGESS